MELTVTGANIVGPAGVFRGSVTISGERFVEVSADPEVPGGPPARSLSLGGSLRQPAGEVYQAGDDWVLPGFVDIHCHGGGGGNVQNGAAEALTAAHFHAAHGTTSLNASLVSAPIDRLRASIAELQGLVEDGTLMGVHLEGPFLAHARCGAHDPANLRPPRPDDVEALLDWPEDLVRMMTLAPELEGGLEAVTRTVNSGVIAAIGHTDCDYPTARRAIDRGATVATHLFNAMPPIHHRAPGPVLAALDDPRVTVELICDGVHLNPGTVRHAARSAAGGYGLVTDAMQAAGAADGRYLLGGQEVEVSRGQARLSSNGALAGSVLTMDLAVRNAVSWGRDVAEVSRAASLVPALAMGLESQIGSITSGKLADLVILDPSFRVKRVLRRGAWLV